jgi:hypothetical protein
MNLKYIILKTCDMKNTASKIINILIILFGIHIYSGAQQILNAGFEDWTNLIPNNWETNSCPFCDPPYETYIVQKDSDACQGKYAAKLIYNNAYSAWLKTKVASSIHPLNLFACIKSTIQSGDSVKIDIILYYNGYAVDSGHWLSKSTISAYSNITIPISQFSTSTDSIDIKITGGTKVNTTLVVDNLSFLLSNDLQQNADNNSWTLSPNPFDGYTWLKFNNSSQSKFVLKIYNVNGQLVKTLNNIYTNEIRIEKDNLTNGIYFFKLTSNKRTTAVGKIIIK